MSKTMFDLDTTNRSPRYQSAERSARHTLDAAVTRYRAAGYTVLSDTGYAVRLAAPTARQNTGESLLLTLISLPLALLSTATRAAAAGETVTLRVTANDEVEEDGYTLARHERQGRDGRLFALMLVLIIVAIYIIRLLTG